MTGERLAQIRLVRRDFVSGWQRSSKVAQWNLYYLGVRGPRAAVMVKRWEEERLRARARELGLRCI